MSKLPAGRRPLLPSQRRPLRCRIESLEGRIAPGCLLDAWAVMALGALGEAAAQQAVVTPENQSGVRGRVRANPAGEARTLAQIAPTQDRGATDAVLAEGAHIRSLDVAPRTAALRFEPRDADSHSVSDGWLVELALASETETPQAARSPVLSAAGNAGVRAPAVDGFASQARSVADYSAPAWGAGGRLAPSGADFTISVSPSDSAVELAPQATEQADNAPAADDADAESRVPRGLPYANQTDREQSLDPYAIFTDPSNGRGPATGVVSSPTEYDPMRGVLFSYASFSSLVTDMVKELTEDPTQDDIAYVVVSSVGQQSTATSQFAAAGADLSKVQFIIQPTNSVWIRDYGPHFITVDDTLAIVDSHYYPNRPLDNFVPTLVGDDNFDVPTYDMGLYYSGGNFQPGPNRTGFATSLVTYHNTVADGFNEEFIGELYQQYQGIDTLHILPQLPFSVDGTGHLDMWMYLIDEDTVMISEFGAGANATAIQITNNAVTYMENLGFEVYRTPAWNVGSTHYTYTNAFRVNDRIFVPVYGTALEPGGSTSYNDEDAAAMAVWQAAAGPGVEIIPIQCSQIIPSAGAIHCIVKQVPRYTGSAPAASILSPAGGEILSQGEPYTIEWSAIDTNNVNPTEVRIYVSYDGGAYQLIATTSDTGSYDWTPNARASSATIKLVARSSDGDEFEVVSNAFEISRGRVRVYDFSSGAGVNKLAFGTQTSSWTAINGNAAPVATALSAGSYSALATSNASGGDTDGNRYIAPVPSPVANESTHVFEFQIAEPVANLAQIDALWEGYADYCSQVELYVWDRVAQNWGDASGLTGNNRYLDSWAGNVDGELTGSIRSDFSRYVDPSGKIRFLVYTDRTGTNPDTQHNAGQGIETFHDYLALTVKQVDRTIGTPAPRPHETGSLV